MECSFLRSGSSLVIELQPVTGAHSLDLLDISATVDGFSLDDRSCIVILRREQSAKVTWAGNPNKAAVVVANQVRLTPRASFAAWEDIILGESTRWSASDLNKAASLREQLMSWQLAREEVRILAHYDAVTELPNRRLLDELLKRALAEADEKKCLVGLLFLDNRSLQALQ
jgi:light-regulated signal transduction histidine kinase (bacteriophytochrome)